MAAVMRSLSSCLDVAQDGAGEFGKEALDEVGPGAVLGREGELEAVRGLIGEPVRRMIVEDDVIAVWAG
jgi:hypothetical protein